VDSSEKRSSSEIGRTAGLLRPDKDLSIGGLAIATPLSLKVNALALKINWSRPISAGVSETE
jgi:hypothetical protein